MVKAFFTLITIFIFTNLYGQKTEYAIGFSSGLFSFSGKSAGKVSFFNYSVIYKISYTNNPYGAKQGFCYGMAGNLKRVSKNNFVFGIEAAYERLRSEIAIDRIVNYDGIVTTQYPADGKTFLDFSFINLEPFAGYRIVSKKSRVDLTAGLDIAYCLEAKESGEATGPNGTTFTTSEDRKTISTDIRPRLQIATAYKNFGIYLGYSFGLANYKSGYRGGTNEAYARFLRFGFTYLLN